LWVEFAFNKNESRNIEDVAYLMKKYFGNKSFCKNVRKNSEGMSMSFNSRKAYEFFLYFFGTRSYNKSLPNFFLTMDKDYLSGFLCGFWRGDGGSWGGAEKTDKKIHRRCCYNFCTTSKKLFEQTRKILLRFGINPVVFIRTPEKHHASIVNNKKVVAKRNLYLLTLYGENALNILNIIQEDNGNISKRKHFFFSNDMEYAIFPILNITREDVVNVNVFNLEVDGDNSYHANGLAVHNCDCRGSENLKGNGACGHRFDKWLDVYDGIVDHKYIFSNMGYNLKPLDLQGAIGSVQLTKFKEIEQRRKHSKMMIEEILITNISGIKGVETLDKADVCWFGTPFICANAQFKRLLVQYLEDHKIQTRNYFAGNILMHPGFKFLGDYKDYPEANKILDKVFFLGSAPHYTDEVFSYIDEVVKAF